MIDEKLNEFTRKYDAYIRPSHRMHRRARRVDFKMWSESDPDLFNTLPYDDVACVEIHMPEDRFRALLEHDDWLHRAQMRNYIKGNEAIDIVTQYERECRVRHQNPAVQDAYEKYQLLLRLCDG